MACARLWIGAEHLSLGLAVGLGKVQVQDVCSPTLLSQHPTLHDSPALDARTLPFIRFIVPNLYIDVHSVTCGELVIWECVSNWIQSPKHILLTSSKHEHCAGRTGHFLLLLLGLSPASAGVKLLSCSVSSQSICHLQVNLTKCA
ncbi:hypothetical protein IE81DRAFT_184026 [Ceraceosorus guamensis]|uniref:Uncharacterized protein n=1 Tax=Ceraceosorus guamensis TaxID=1522189 RepID=A0A316VU82_9BASI|nr:hypothetical protein IE81DRAFT_184026 [Ceraceosorus guamensis]PWN41186.1 hypothetical protein IE81DRAFT_184026 [Ceraceosorus guamensis]